MGALAYFQWLNARDGVYGRTISYTVLDDQGNSRLIPSLAHQLVQGRAVFALLSPVGVQDSVIQDLVIQYGVPDLFTPSANSQETFEWPLSSTREGKILGDWTSQHYAGQKIGIVYGPDRADKARVTGFLAAAYGVGISAKLPLSDVSGAGAEIARAKAARVKLLVALTPSNIIASLKTAMVAAKFMVPLVASGSGLAYGLPDGVITDGFLPSVNATGKSADASWISLFRRIQQKYLPHSSLTSAVIDGMSTAYLLADAMFRAGPDLTRPGLIAALNGLQPGPASAPLEYSTSDHTGPEGAYIGIMRQGSLLPMSDVLVTDDSTTGAVTTYAYPQQTAPADGIPPH